MPTPIREHRHLPMSVPQAFAILSTREHWERRVRVSSEMRTILRSLESIPEGFSVATHSTVPVDWLPSRIRHHSNRLPYVDRVETWRLDGDQAVGQLQFHFDGVDAQAGGIGSITEGAGGSHYSVNLDLGVSVLVVGGLVERVVAGNVRHLLRRELELLAAG